jgi:hypothetical protein
VFVIANTAADVMSDRVAKRLWTCIVVSSVNAR